MRDAVNHRRLWFWGLIVGSMFVTVAVTKAPEFLHRPQTPSDPPELWVTLDDDGFAVDWDSTPGGDRDGYELAVLKRDRVGGEWVDDGEWRISEVADTHSSLTDVSEETNYLFRVRERDGEWSQIVERSYVVPTLPVVRMTTDDGDMILQDRGTYREGTFSVAADGTGDVAGVPAEIRARGNSTWRYVTQKKSYQVKLGQEQGLLGMAPAKRWVLLANAFDRSQLRNFAAFELARRTGLGWVPSCDWVELILNGDYRGVYQLCEKIEVAPDKLDIGRLTPGVTDGEAITGGYIVSFGTTPPGDKQHWQTPVEDLQVAIYRPRADDSNAEQTRWIRNYVDEIEQILYSDDFADPENGYRAWLDVDSFIDYWIVEELTLDDDAFLSSFYAYKERGVAQLRAGPVWDFDKSMGSDYSRLEPEVDGWYTMHPGVAGADSRGWIVRLFEDPAFVMDAAARWNALLPAIRQVPDEVRAAGAMLGDATERDRFRWADEVDTNPRWKIPYGEVSEADSPEFIAEWLADRTVWITDNLVHFEATFDPGPRIAYRTSDR